MGLSKKNHDPNWFTSESLKSKQLLCSLDSSLSCSLVSGLVQTVKRSHPIDNRSLLRWRCCFCCPTAQQYGCRLFFPPSLLTHLIVASWKKKKSLRLSPILFHLLWVELWRVFPFLFFPYQKHYPEFPPLLLHRERGTDKDVLVKTLLRLNSSLSTSKLFTAISGQQSSLFPLLPLLSAAWQSVCSRFSIYSSLYHCYQNNPRPLSAWHFFFQDHTKATFVFRQSLTPYQESRSVCRSTQIGDIGHTFFFYPQATTEIQKGNTRRRILHHAFSSSCLSRGNSPNPKGILMYGNSLHLITPQHYLQPTLAYKSIPCLCSKPSNIFNQRPALRTITDTCTHPLSRSMGTSAARLQWTNQPRWRGNTINPALRWRSLCVRVVGVCACQRRNNVWKHKSKAGTPRSAKCRTAKKSQLLRSHSFVCRQPGERYAIKT